MARLKQIYSVLHGVPGSGGVDRKEAADAAMQKTTFPSIALPSADPTGVETQFARREPPICSPPEAQKQFARKDDGGACEAEERWSALSADRHKNASQYMKDRRTLQAELRLREKEKQLDRIRREYRQDRQRLAEKHRRRVERALESKAKAEETGSPLHIRHESDEEAMVSRSGP